MKERFFDFEVFPNWWCCVFGDLPEGEITEDIKDTFTVVTSDSNVCRDELLTKLKEEGYVQMGYNIKHYDLVIANGVWQGLTPQQLRILNDIIINPSMQWASKEHMRIAPMAKRKLKIVYEDLMDDGGGSLKEIEAILGLNILESSVPFDKENLTEFDKADIIYYCKQDVYAAMIYFAKIVKSYSDTKLIVGKRFGIPEDVCYASTNAKMVAMALNAKRASFADADDIAMTLPSQIKDYCYKNLPSKIVDRILSNVDSFEVKLFDNNVVFGNGGIHSVYSENMYVESNSEYALVNVDAASYYPSEMIQFGLLSRTVRNPIVFKNIFDERIAIKHKKNKTAEDEEINMANKLILNTTFGASGNKYLDLYDPYMCTKVCRTGQIFLGAFANKVFKSVPTAKIIQTNTDGVLIYLNRKWMYKLEECMQEWTALSNINMELEEVLKIWQRDVNNYLMVELDKGKEVVKCRGAWLKDYIHRTGGVRVMPLSAFVCAKAAKDWLMYGKDIVQSIVNNTNLTDFMMTCTKGPTYRGVIHRLANGMELELYKANRVIATKDASLGRLYKIKMYKGNISYTQMPNTPEHCKTMNEDLSTYNFSDIQKELDYMYYIYRTLDLLDIEWKELSGNNFNPTNKFEYNF